MMPGPITRQESCYFYNRHDSGGIRFLSYHYEHESDITESFEDTKMIIETLFQ